MVLPMVSFYKDWVGQEGIIMSLAKKITVEIPEELLSKAQKATKQSITETIRQGLRLVAASEAYENLRKLRGKVKFSISLKALREEKT